MSPLLLVSETHTRGWSGPLQVIWSKHLCKIDFKVGAGCLWPTCLYSTSLMVKIFPWYLMGISCPAISVASYCYTVHFWEEFCSVSLWFLYFLTLSQPLKLHGIYYGHRTLHMLLLNFRKFIRAFFKLVEISKWQPWPWAYFSYSFPRFVVIYKFIGGVFHATALVTSEAVKWYWP